MAWIAAGLAAVLLVASLVWITVHLRNEPAPPVMVKFQIPVPDQMRFSAYQIPAVSPDGQRIAFTASDSSGQNPRLFVRSLNASTATEIPVPGSSPEVPFWSPDSQQIAFYSHGDLQKVDVSGGSPVTICSGCVTGYGGTWNRDGVILVATAKGLFRVSAAGGEAKLLRPLAQGETSQSWPEFLPDGKHYLYFSGGIAPYHNGTYVASLDSNERKAGSRKRSDDLSVGSRNMGLEATSFKLNFKLHHYPEFTQMGFFGGKIVMCRNTPSSCHSITKRRTSRRSMTG
jgi:hypothetical protein